MREILFRGKRSNGEWVEGNLIIFPKSKRTKIMVWNSADLDFDAIEVRSETVGQYTSATDESGERIFEGDILEHVRLDEKEYFVVKWDAICGAWVAKRTDDNKTIFCSPLRRHLKIIGNIHDNPELLEVQE